jgi:DNA-binding response OmpR family regulator
VREGDLTLDVSRRKATRAGRAIELTASEFQLLLTLASQPGRIFTRSQLLDALHGTAFESYERAIDAHMKNVRKKLEPDPRRPRYLLTVYGVGYKFRDEAES